MSGLIDILGDPKALRLRLKAERLRHGLTFAQVAEAIGVGERTIHRLEIGKLYPSSRIIGKLIKFYNLKLEDFEGEASSPERILQRVIEFPPEFKQAGIAILSHFSEILNSEYPTENIGVSISQEISTVTLKIKRPNGKIEEIAKRLDEYGQAVTGQMPLEKFSQDKEVIRELKTRLEITGMELRLKKEFYLEQTTQANQRILSLENQVTALTSLVASGISQTNTLTEILKTLAAKEQVSQKVLLALIRIGEASVSTENKEAEVTQALEEIKQEEPSFYERVVKQLDTVPAAIIANLASPWFQDLLKNLPKL